MSLGSFDSLSKKFWKITAKFCTFFQENSFVLDILKDKSRSLFLGRKIWCPPPNAIFLENKREKMKKYFLRVQNWPFLKKFEKSEFLGGRKIFNFFILLYSENIGLKGG